MVEVRLFALCTKGQSRSVHHVCTGHGAVADKADGDDTSLM